MAESLTLADKTGVGADLMMEFVKVRNFLADLALRPG